MCAFVGGGTLVPLTPSSLIDEVWFCFTILSYYAPSLLQAKIKGMMDIGCDCVIQNTLFLFIM